MKDAVRVARAGEPGELRERQRGERGVGLDVDRPGGHEVVRLERRHGRRGQTQVAGQGLDAGEVERRRLGGRIEDDGRVQLAVGVHRAARGCPIGGSEQLRGGARSGGRGALAQRGGRAVDGERCEREGYERDDRDGSRGARGR